ncbi:MAG TPA: hypothetical protein VN706_23140 [Gemmatimonadaceae bacterium]|nr:hypothetical protein [Gemmatimonadaceae bacterium]
MSRLERMAWTTLLAAVAAVLGIGPFVRPGQAAPTAPFAAVANEVSRLSAGPSGNAFGTSRAVRFRFAMPDASVEFPLEVSGDPASLTYEWVPVRDTTTATIPQPVNGSTFVTPSQPGYYRLAIVRGLERQIISQPTLAVMVPFREKVGGVLNGYHIGTYLAERFGHRDEHPAGFLEVNPSDLSLRVSTHLRLGDFVTHDNQANVWPKYVALSPRLLDKLELVLAKVGGRAAMTAVDEADAPDDQGPLPNDVAFDVHSGFRTPAHNHGVWRAARDSRHQYGDAADVAIDADGDGRVTLRDEVLVARAVEQVEREHPDLVGGLGLYTSRHYRTPYVHIDARGKRSRWTG